MELLKQHELSTGIYVRVSTEEQALEGYSIRAQIEKLTEYCKIMGWKVYNVYADEGISGKNITARPEINKLIADVEKGLVKNVLVFKIDRLTRSVRDLIELTDIFTKNDCAFNSLMEKIDTSSASGRMFLKIIGIFAEFERENLSERVTVANERKVKEGFTLCGANPSYGYDRPQEDKIQTVNEEEAVIVKEVFRMYLEENKSMHQIACNLNLMNIPTKQNSYWTSRTIKKVLVNVNYIGKVRYSIENPNKYFETEGHHKPIIDIETFDKVQKKLGLIKKVLTTKRPRDDNYFTGLLYCGICGGKLTTHGKYKTNKKGNTIYMGGYRCSNHMIKVCPASQMSHKKIETAFIEYLEKVTDLQVADEINEKDFVEQKEILLKKEELENALTKLETKASHTMTMYIEEKISYEEYRKMIKIINTKMKSIKTELEKIEISSDEETTVQKNDLIINIKKNWEFLSNVEKADYLQRFVSKIVVTNKKAKDEPFGTVIIENVEFLQS